MGSDQSTPKPLVFEPVRITSVIKPEEKQNTASDWQVDEGDTDSDEDPWNEKFPSKRMIAGLQTLQNHEAKCEVNEDGSVTFWPTPNCEIPKERLDKTELDIKYILKRSKCGTLEASSDSTANVINSKVCSFITASIDAWANHYPIRYRPEHIWLLILQAVAIHVDKHAEKLRKKYVNHEGKMELTVRRDGFVLGSDKNDWEGVIAEFATQIDANTVKDTAQLFDCDFSGSSPMEKLCTKVTIMDICKNYFSYGLMTCCGFPRITLDGTKSDWIRLREKTNMLLKTKVDEKWGAKWSVALLPVLDRFIGAFDGDIDCLFWNSMIKRGATFGSGARSWFTGWFNILFPFDSKNNRNRFCVPYSTDEGYVKQALSLSTGSTNGLGDGNYSTGLAQAPVTWYYLGSELKLKFIAGFMGYQQDPNTLEVCPNLGWCIGHEVDKAKKKGKVRKGNNAKPKNIFD